MLGGQGKYVVDLFGGTGGVAKAVRKLGLNAMVVDRNLGPAFDLLSEVAVRSVLRGLSRGEVVGLMIATPCTTWSIAKRTPQTLRTKGEPWGVGYFVSEDARKQLEEGNQLMRNTLRIIALAMKMNIPWIFEHPATSYVFDTEEWQRLLSSLGVWSARIDQCSFGTRWRKRTRIVCFGVSETWLDFLVNKFCRGRGTCEFTNKPHICLRGKDANNVCWTLRAQAYPAKLATMFAKMLIEPFRVDGFVSK